ncbi:hypothetical protein BJ912DRAFT_541705 [Pholiota molesta]|nr:hypothetical protein BJ912DRAFT_541705 [Pholiota molesta]
MLFGLIRFLFSWRVLSSNFTFKMAIYSTASLQPPSLHSFHPYPASVDSHTQSNSERGRFFARRNHSTTDGLPLFTSPSTTTRPLPNIPEPPRVTTQMAMNTRESFGQGQYTSSSPSSSPSWHPQELSVLHPSPPLTHPSGFIKLHTQRPALYQVSFLACTTPLPFSLPFRIPPSWALSYHISTGWMYILSSLLARPCAICPETPF